MAPIQTKQMPDLSDDLRRDLEQAYSPELQYEAAAAFRELDKSGPIETSVSSESTRGIVSSEMAEGEPVSPRELFSSDQRYIEATRAVEAAREQNTAARIERESSLTVKIVGQRVGALRDRFAKE